MSLRASHFVILAFVGFAGVVAVRESDAGRRSAADAGPEKVVHHWRSKNAEVTREELHGLVLDAIGMPVEGATVADALGGRQVRTDADGGFTLGVAAGRTIRLVANGPDGSTDRLSALPGETPTFVLRPPQPWSAEVLAEDSPPRGGKGLVKGFEGRVVVTVCETGERVCADAGGNFQIPVPGMPFRLLAWDDHGHVAMTDEVPAPRPDQRWMPLPDVVLEDGLSIAGFVRDAAGEPVEGATLELEGEGLQRRLVSGQGGAFGAKGLLVGEYRVTALPRDGAVGMSREFVIEETAVPPAIEMRLRPEKPLRIQVVDEGGAVQPGVCLKVTDREGAWTTGQSNELGEVLLRGLGSSECDFEAWRPMEAGYAEAEVVAFRPDDRALVLR